VDNSVEVDGQKCNDDKNATHLDARRLEGFVHKYSLVDHGLESAGKKWVRNFK
jgi:hypothetical protein